MKRFMQNWAQVRYLFVALAFGVIGVLLGMWGSASKGAIPKVGDEILSVDYSWLRELSIVSGDKAQNSTFLRVKKGGEFFSIITSLKTPGPVISSKLTEKQKSALGSLSNLKVKSVIGRVEELSREALAIYGFETSKGYLLIDTFTYDPSIFSIGKSNSRSNELYLAHNGYVISVPLLPLVALEIEK